MIAENFDSIISELGGLANLHRCPACQQRGVLKIGPVPVLTANAVGELSHQFYCTGCECQLWIKCADMGQHFRFTDATTGRAFVYSIPMAEEIVAGREPELELSPEQMADALRVNDESPNMDLRWAFTRDLGLPLIMIPSPVAHPSPKPGARCIIIIDGWHRMAKAVLMRRPMLAHCLTEEEASRCLACVTDLGGGGCQHEPEPTRSRADRAHH